MATYTFFKTAKIVEVDAPFTSANLQEVAEQIQQKEATFDMMDVGHIMDAVGKAEVPGGFTGITITMANNWRMRFAARAGPTVVPCELIGGVLTAPSGNLFPIADSAFTFVTRSIDVTPALVSGTGGLTQQQVRDSMKLAPTAGAPASGSIDQQLTELYDTNRGGWTIDQNTNEMIFYKDDNVTELFRTALFDKDNNPTALGDVFKRTKV